MEDLNEKAKSWASIMEDEAREQVLRTASMRGVWPHVAVMPDVHYGKGATVGSVIPTLGMIMPAAVGVDIGCGMAAVRTRHHVDQIAHLDLSVVRKAIEKAIPLGKGNINTQLTETAEQAIEFLEARAVASRFTPSSYMGNWRLHLGSLGSGNHFCEICVDEEGFVWLFLHSGSRGIGNRIAQHHIKVAQRLCEQWYIDLPDKDLAYIAQGTDEFWDYIREMMWAQEFAEANRVEMMRRMIAAFEAWSDSEIVVDTEINCHHNYTAQEEHWGKKLWITRKGAINAEEGRLGLIPGSMGTASYVVKGKGNPVSFNSSPHGAGRNYSRTKAKAEFTHEQLRERMVGIEWNDKVAFLDEIPDAYKDIDQIMADADDLVEVVHKLRQIVNVKGE
jgi:tRNA-splicing ligase RtcB